MVAPSGWWLSPRPLLDLAPGLVLEVDVKAQAAMAVQASVQAQSLPEVHLHRHSLFHLRLAPQRELESRLLYSPARRTSTALDSASLVQLWESLPS